MAKKIDTRAQTWGMFCHLSALSMFMGVPFGIILGPLVIWLMKRNEIPYVDEQGKESINFQLSMILYMVVAGIMCIFLIGFALLFALIVAEIVLVIRASIKVSNGEEHHYPFAIRWIF
jgi:uncharacterized Tic20 family protein